MTTRALQKRLFTAAVLFGVLAAGCELIVDFDRTLIPVESPDSSVDEGGTSLGDGATTDGTTTDGQATDGQATDGDASTSEASADAAEGG